MRDMDWVVMRIENNPLLKDVLQTRIMDVEKVTGLSPQDLIWASPPCRDFSQAYSAPASIANRLEEDFEPDMSVVEACYQIIMDVEPTHWIIENVVGAIPHFEELLGAPRQIVGPFVLWGNFPLLHLPPYWRHSKVEKDPHSSNPLRANVRALIPLELSQAVLDAVTVKTLHDYPPL